MQNLANDISRDRAKGLRRTEARFKKFFSSSCQSVFQLYVKTDANYNLQLVKISPTTLTQNDCSTLGNSFPLLLKLISVFCTRKVILMKFTICEIYNGINSIAILEVRLRRFSLCFLIKFIYIVV